jgi:hypothetical protein
MQPPASPGELTADWLTSVLHAQGLNNNRIESCDVELLGGEQGMTGQLTRLRVRYQHAHPGLPMTLIAKFAAADPAARMLISALGHYEREVRFYQEMSTRAPVRTPHCYYSHFESETGFALLLLEDLTRVRNGNSIAGCSVDEVAQVLVQLAVLHATWWQAPDLDHASWLRMRFLLAPEAMVGAFRDAWPNFLKKLSIPITSRISEMGDWIGENLPKAAALFVSGPRTLIHNDVQADNLFFGEADEDVVFIDWQLVTHARSVIDVAGWVRGQLEPEVRRATEPQLLRLYHDALMAKGVQDYTFEQCMADYQLATVLAPGRLAAAVGLSEGLQAHPGAFWDTLFPRYLD